MRIHVFQHEEIVAPGWIEVWAVERGVNISYTRFFRGEDLPIDDESDAGERACGLIVLGGSMNVDQEDRHPWLRAEKRFLAQALAQKRKVMGICLGGQLLAEVLGAPVGPHKVQEIGWFPVTTVPGSAAAANLLPEHAWTCFHWHGYSFELPPGAIHLASSDACVNQAFSWRDHALGIQFHPEVTVEILENYLSFPLPPPSESVQTKEQMRSHQALKRNQKTLMFHLLDSFFG